MFTQSSPALVNALLGTLPDNAVRALTQSLGNCNQPLTHRGAVNLQPSNPPQDGPGIYTDQLSGQWNPADYSSLLPNTSTAAAVDIPGWDSADGPNNRNFYGDNFNFPTSQEFAINNYYGGPNTYVGGNTFLENAYTTNQTTVNHSVENLTVKTINGQPVAGPAGPPGANGENGQRGADGVNGINGIGINGRDGIAALLPPFRKAQLPDGVKLRFSNAEIVSNVTFDPETCDLTVDKAKIKIVTGVELTTRVLQFYGPG